MNLELLLLAIPFGYLIAVAPPLAIIDIQQHRLPNVLTLPGIAVSFVCVVAVAAMESKWLELVVSIGVSLLTLIIGYPLARAELLGMGDIKLLIAFSIPLSFISPMALLIGIVLSLMIANVFVLPRLILRKLRSGTAVALGPYLLVGLISVFGYQLMELSPVGVWS